MKIMKLATDEQVLNALLLIADFDIELLSYKGQTLFNELSEKEDE